MESSILLDIIKGGISVAIIKDGSDGRSVSSIKEQESMGQIDMEGEI